MSAVRRHAGLLGLAAVSAALLGLYVTRVPAPPAASDPREAQARARLTTCLVGEPPHRGGVRLDVLRAIQLTVINAGETGPGAWPQRCAAYAAELETAATSERMRADAAAAKALIAAGTLFEQGHLPLPLRALLARPWGAVASSEPARDVPAPPAPFVAAHATVALRTLHTRSAGERGVALLFDAQTACRFAPDDGGVAPVARCSWPATSLAVAANRWWPVDGGDPDAPLRVVTDETTVREFATGARVFPSSTVTVAAEHAGWVLGWPADRSRTSVVRRDPAGVLSTVRLPRAADDAALVRDLIVWREGRRVVAATVIGAALGPVQVVAPLGADLGESCATADVAGVTLELPEGASRVAVLAGGRWVLAAPGPRYELTCAGSAVTGLAMELDDGGATIDRLDCTAAGCTTQRVTLPGITEPAAAAALGEATLVVWTDDLVRAVEAPLAALPTAPPFVVYDGFRIEADAKRAFRGLDLVQGLDVVVRGRSAIVVLHGSDTSVVHVRDRRASPVRVTWE